MTTVLHITDTHIVPDGALVSGRLETGAPLDRLVQRFLDIRDQIGMIDAVLVSGDLSDDGSDESYVRFKEIMAPLGLPLYVIPGNHDAREPMRAAFLGHGYFPETGKLNWHRRIGDIHLVGLDTLIEGEGGGTLDAETLSLLAGALTAAGQTPVLLALHHPPFASGIAFMDAIGLKNRAALREVLSDHEGEVRIVCGHIHSMMVATVGRHVAVSAPAPCSSFAHDTRADAPIGFMDMPDGCLVHKWDNGFQTIRIGPESGAGPFPF